MNDWELLQAYSAQRSERAFEQLVHRYLNLVYSAALRQARDPHLAEEVSQAVFMVLARKAGQLSRDTLLAGWLFRTARFVASRAVRSEQRRQSRERKIVAMSPDAPSAESWENLEPLLDEAMARLSAKDRDAVLLRFFQDKPLKDVGLSLGTSEDAAKKRVARAVEKLRAFFAGRGFTVSVAFLTGGLAMQAVKAAPLDLASAVLRAAHAGTSARQTLRPLLH